MSPMEPSVKSRDGANAAVAEVVQDASVGDGVVVKSLNYAFQGQKPFLSDFSMELPRGSRCLLLGANGAGKTTLLQILAGKYMVPEDAVRVLGRPPFHDMDLTCKGDLSFLGTAWRRDVAFAGYDIPLQGDIGAGEMIMGVPDVDPARRARLMELLDVDPNWRMNKVSDGQRRRVQITMGLLKPYTVLLLDEITVDMDVVGRLDLLKFFEEECEERGCVIIYATHIFDGLEKWITHLAFVSEGVMQKGGPVSEIPELGSGKLLNTVFDWLTEEREKRRAYEKVHGKKVVHSARSTPKFPSKHMAYF